VRWPSRAVIHCTQGCSCQNLAEGSSCFQCRSLEGVDPSAELEIFNGGAKLTTSFTNRSKCSNSQTKLFGRLCFARSLSRLLRPVDHPIKLTFSNFSTLPFSLFLLFHDPRPPGSAPSPSMQQLGGLGHKAGGLGQQLREFNGSTPPPPHRQLQPSLH
jgi:hypothetical protein